MNPVEFPGSIEIKKPTSMTDEECFSVWAEIEYNKQYPKVVESFTTAWKPSYEDLQSLNRGGSIRIKSISQRLVPMAVYTIDENGNCNDAN